MKADEILKKLRALIDKAKAEGREFTDEEQRQWDELEPKYKAALAMEQRQHFVETEERVQGGPGTNRRTHADSAAPLGADLGELTPVEWRTSDGRAVRHYASNQRIANMESSGFRSTSAGEWVRARHTGDVSRLTERELRALNEGTNTAGGMMVPDELSSMVVDNARAKSVMVQAGATTMLMHSDLMRIVRVTSDPTMAIKAENAAFAESEVTFGAVELVARTIGCLVKISEELLRDAPNAGQVLDMVMAAALAAEIDRLFLQGDGSAGEPIGLDNDPGLLDGAAIDHYDDVLDGMKLVEDQNGVANALILNPAQNNTLRKLKDNTSGLYLQPPADYTALRKLVSTNCPSGSGFVGDFRYVLLGTHGPLAVEFDRSGEHFDKYQAAFRVVARIAMATARPNHIARLAASFFHRWRGGSNARAALPLQIAAGMRAVSFRALPHSRRREGEGGSNLWRRATNSAPSVRGEHRGLKNRVQGAR